MQCAVDNGHQEIVAMFLSLDHIDINAVDVQFGYSVLHSAIGKGYTHIVKILLGHKNLTVINRKNTRVIIQYLISPIVLIC